MEWTGSPTKKTSSSFTVFDENTHNSYQQYGFQRTASAMHLPLTTSRFANRAGAPPPQRFANMGQNDNEKKLMAEILVKLRERDATTAAAQQTRCPSPTDTDPYSNTPPAGHSPEEQLGPDEVYRLKRELDQAKERMAQMNLQLDQSRLVQHTMQEALGSPFPNAQMLAANIPSHAMPSAGSSFAQAMPSAGNSFAQATDYSRASTPFERGSFNSQSQSFDGMQGFSGYPRNQSGYGGGGRTGYTPPITPMPYTQSTYMQPAHAISQQQQPPIGTRLSPTAAEFGVGRGQWTGQPQPQATTYLNTTEPLNYRRLLERNMSCNWKYIVDKIVCNNDQQASIFLQQKLKVGTQEAKLEIVQAIIDQAYPLMINRFGNFLVQRCFEHGNPDQIIQIGKAIRGNTLNLSMDAFGCHVVQKAFDCVPEEYKAVMVHELLRRIPETVIHRYACHVWQKLFELRWSGSPPQIMKFVNEALNGMWHEVALGETGSLVVQNIFENCLEEDKRPCIDEILSSIDVVAHGQFGNWCIQHICEHGSIPDRTRAIDHVIRFASEYSMDQFASKVVEKCLKIGGNNFLDRYLERICEARQDRPRMPLIDISGDQFGNYLIQYILSSAEPQRREDVAAQIRKHMVSLRGSKYGSRVAMLCCNPAVTIRPAGLPMGRGNGPFGHSSFGQDMSRSFPAERAYVGRGGYGGYR